MKSLAVEYRPSTWSDVTEQASTIEILQNQINTGDLRNAYLFCGASGCGKTTCARIFANDINNGQGVPIEMDAASNSSVDDVREIIKMAQTRSIDSEYKIFIIDECHSISNTGWQAFLKAIEEPPAKSIFIFCTTDPQKIPKTILNRVQRYDFKRISLKGIINRLSDILAKENVNQPEDGIEVLEFIARQAKGGMRDAISMLDKCLAYSEELTMENVVEALELPDTDTFIDLTYMIHDRRDKDIVEIIESEYERGIDLKQFIKQYMIFLLDVLKYSLCGSFKYTSLPNTDEVCTCISDMTKGSKDFDNTLGLLKQVINIDSEIKWSQSPKELIEARLLTI